MNTSKGKTEVNQMKKVVRVVKEYRVNGDKWIDISLWKHIIYKEETECKNKMRKIDNWKDALEYLKNDMLRNSSVEYTIFKRTPYLHLYNPENLDYEWIDVKEKEFELLEVRLRYIEYPCSLKELVDLLPANDFIQYLKDRGISTCPMLK